MEHRGSLDLAELCRELERALEERGAQKETLERKQAELSQENQSL